MTCDNGSAFDEVRCRFTWGLVPTTLACSERGPSHECDETCTQKTRVSPWDAATCMWIDRDVAVGPKESNWECCEMTPVVVPFPSPVACD